MVVAAARDDVFRLLGTLVSGRFRVDAQIAEGGFAVVYRACQVALDRQVALKVLKTPVGYDDTALDDFRERFAAEARTIARLKHPHIVDVYDFDVSVGPTGQVAPWMALEWLDGETLERRLERLREEGQHGLVPRDALELIRPAIQALAFAHDQGVVHRDVKPANIMVCETDRARTVRVLDFGIAKLMQVEEPAGTGRTRTGSVPAFSPAYAAPEQVTFSRTGPWTDVHALGLTLTALLTGEPPFSDPDATVHEQVMAARRPTPASKGRDVGPLEAVIAKALALSPGARFRNAGELLAALDEAAGGTRPSAPVAVAVAVAVPRGRKKIAAAIALAALAGVLAGSWAWRSRAPASAPAPAAVRREPSPAPKPEKAQPIPPVPETPSAAVSASALAPAVPAPPRKATRRKRPDPAPAPAPAPAGPKRTDLFDDTK